MLSKCISFVNNYELIRYLMIYKKFKNINIWNDFELMFLDQAMQSLNYFIHPVYFSPNLSITIMYTMFHQFEMFIYRS